MEIPMKRAICDWLKRPMPKATAMMLAIIPALGIVLGLEYLGFYLGTLVDPAYTETVQCTGIGLAVFAACFGIVPPHLVEYAIEAC